MQKSLKAILLQDLFRSKEGKEKKGSFRRKRAFTMAFHFMVGPYQI